MKILLDTHVIIWALTNDARLSEKAKALITAPENIICISTASLWEIAIKNQKAPEKCPYHEQEILHYCIQAGFEPLSILPGHILGIRTLKEKDGHYLSNYDPFDRLIIAQAKVENARVLSHDSNFNHYDEDCIIAI